MPSHLTLEERDRIAQSRYQGYDQQDVARALGRSPATVSRELRRNRQGGEYYAGQAQCEAERRRRERPITGKMAEAELKEAVRTGLAQDWSPEQIAGRLQQQHPEQPESHVSAQTIDRWIATEANCEHWPAPLRRRGKRPRRRKNQAGAEAARIEDRPEVIDERLRLGDFEGDTVLGPPGTGGLATLVDRRSRFLIVLKIQFKNANHVHEKLKQRLKELDEEHRRSITFDNGTEFARCQRLEKHLGIELCFADPGCPYQRGTNENTHGLIRQYFPKGTDFRNVSPAETRRAAHLLNNRPRECLGFRTPTEVFFEKTPTTDCD